MVDVEIISAMIANAIRDAFERGVRAGREETLDEAARKTAELGSLSKYPSGRVRPVTGDANLAAQPGVLVTWGNGGCGNG